MQYYSYQLAMFSSHGSDPIPSLLKTDQSAATVECWYIGQSGISTTWPQPVIVTSSDWLASKAFPDWLRIWNQNTYLLQSVKKPFILPVLTHNTTPDALMCANRDGWTWKLINRWRTCYRSNSKLNARCADVCKQLPAVQVKIIQ